MLLSKENTEIRNKISGFEQRIEEMHLAFHNYLYGVEKKMPEWERLEMEILDFSRKRINDLELSKNLERVLYKFQNRKKIWLNWVEESHHTPRKGEK